MEHTGRRKLLIILLAILIAAAVWYGFSLLTIEKNTMQGTLVEAFEKSVL